VNQIIARIPNRRAIAFDMRGHGLSAKPEPPYEWHVFGEDTAALARALGLRGATGVGTRWEAIRCRLPQRWRPRRSPNSSDRPRHHAASLYTGRPREPHFARRRRNQWTSPDEMFESFKDRLPFRTWDPAVLRDYCDYGLCRPVTATVTYWPVLLR